MAERNWGLIRSGATFESLVATIICFEDSRATVFGRRGPDGGQDARSGDGCRVFQAKHHADGSAAAALRDAKAEVAKIKQYRRPESPRYGQWRDVIHWRLVTNAEFNPRDHERWQSEIKPLFAEQGLDADYWGRSELDKRLTEYTDVDRSFFEGETRVFLSLPEAREVLLRDEPFLHREELTRFVGRTAELAKVRAFQDSEKIFLVIHGAGGVGKTRLALESGERAAESGDWQVLWANVASLEATASWFHAIVPERPTLLLVDEPPDHKVLQRLLEQTSSRAAKWKVVVTVRSLNDPVLGFLRAPQTKERVQELPLDALATPEAEQMCLALINAGKFADRSADQKLEFAKKLIERFGGNPVWLALAIDHIERHGDLAHFQQDASELADEYLKSIWQRQGAAPDTSLRALIQWIALLGVLDRKDTTLLDLVGKRTGIGGSNDVLARVATLVEHRVLRERGAWNRLVEFKPDVLRDRVLRNWLVLKIGRDQYALSNDAKELLSEVVDAIVDGKLDRHVRAALVALARTDFLLRLIAQGVALLQEFFGRVKDALPQMTATRRIALAEVLQDVAEMAPGPATSLVTILRESPVDTELTETVFGTRRTEHADVVLALARPLFGAAMGAQSQGDREAVMRELMALTEREAQLATTLPKGLPNDGKRAAELLSRIIAGGPQFLAEYDEVAATLALEVLDDLGAREPTPERRAHVKALVESSLAAERHQSWSDDQTFTFRNVVIAPDSPAGIARRRVLNRLRAVLEEDGTPTSSRILLWHVFAEAHRSSSRISPRSGGEASRAALLDDLVWTRKLLEAREAGTQELRTARDVWNWHLVYDKDPEFRGAASLLESIYQRNGLAAEFDPLSRFTDLSEKDKWVLKKAEELANSGDPGSIQSFIGRAAEFFGGDNELRRVLSVAWELGKLAEDSEIVKAFVAQSFGGARTEGEFGFAVHSALTWVASVRRARPEKVHLLVEQLVGECSNDERRTYLLAQLYGRIPKFREIGKFTADEQRYLRTMGELFGRVGKEVEFVGALAVSAHHDWMELQPVLGQALDAVPDAQVAYAMRTLVDAVYWVAQEEDDRAPAGLWEWLLNRLLKMPDIDDLGGMGEWHLNEIARTLGLREPVDVRWLPNALRQRRQLELDAAVTVRARAVGFGTRVSLYVRKLVDSDANEPAVEAAVREVVGFAGCNDSVGYQLPDILSDIDPTGIVVPRAIAERAEAANEGDLYWIARLAKAYHVGSAPWRVVALAVLRAAKAYGAKGIDAVHRALNDRGIRSWSGRAGEVHSMFRDEVAAASAALDAEVKPELIAFWQTRLDRAKGELQDQEELAREERGE